MAYARVCLIIQSQENSPRGRKRESFAFSVRVMFAPNKASQQLPNDNGTIIWKIQNCGLKSLDYIGILRPEI
jgi:hypothetical protein